LQDTGVFLWRKMQAIGDEIDRLLHGFKHLYGG
jgi:hypothetical protein